MKIEIECCLKTEASLNQTGDAFSINLKILIHCSAVVDLLHCG